MAAVEGRDPRRMMKDGRIHDEGRETGREGGKIRRRGGKKSDEGQEEEEMRRGEIRAKGKMTAGEQLRKQGRGEIQ